MRQVCHRLRSSLYRSVNGSLQCSGAWLIHPTLILLAKVLIDAVPGMTQDLSWTIVNLGYMAVSSIDSVLADGELAIIPHVSSRYRCTLRIDVRHQTMSRVQAYNADRLFAD